MALKLKSIFQNIFTNKHCRFKVSCCTEMSSLSDFHKHDDQHSNKLCSTATALAQKSHGMSKEGLTQLMHLIDQGNFVEASYRCMFYPNEATTRCVDNSGVKMLPIHLFFLRVNSCSNDGQEREAKLENALLNTLIGEYMDGLQLKDSDGSLPLHIACKRNARMSLIQILIKGNEESVRITDNSGRLPLHYACEYYVNRAIVCDLVSKYPEAVYIGDKDGLTPLDLLAISKE